MTGLPAVALLAAALPNAVVLQPAGNMYSQPSMDADVVSQAIYGSNVAVLERKQGWARVRTGDSYAGWMPATALRAAQPYAATGRTAEVSSLFAHIYREPSVKKHAPLLTAPFGARLEVSSEPPEYPSWVLLRLPDDRAGWVQAGDLEFNPPLLSAGETASFAKRFVGVPYTWGGTSAFGFDCSGFIQMLMRRRGIGMPRDSQPQADWSGSEPVERKDAQPGDLLYFGAAPTKVTHTGMYLGNGKFINATTYQTPAVRIDDLNDPHWSPLLVAVKRVKRNPEAQ